MRQCVLMIIMVLLAGCAKQAPQGGSTVEGILTSLSRDIAANQAVSQRDSKYESPAIVDAVLIPEANYEAPEVKAQLEHHFNLAVQDVPAKTFFTSLVKDTPYSVVVDPNVNGTISLNLKNVTIEDVLQAVRDTYGYRQTSYGFEVLPTGLQTRVFNVSYLNVSRKGSTTTTISSGHLTEGDNNNAANNGGVNGATLLNNPNNNNNNQQVNSASSSVTTESETDFWKELQATLEAMVGTRNGRSFVVQPLAGIVVVRADSNTLREVQDYLQTIQNNMNRTVILEAKIIEVQLNNGNQAGIDWQLFGANQVQDLTDSSKSFASIFTVKMSNGNAFSALMKFLATQGNIQTLSNPRISTINNQKAMIKVGQDQFFVTGLTTTTVASATSNNNLQNVDMTPFFSGIALDVTPQIDHDGDVILHIHPSVSVVTENEVKVTAGKDEDLKLPSAKSKIRESDSIVRAKNGQVIVIGGLMEDSREEDTNATPFLGDVPFVGSLFRNNKQTAVKSELVILLRPIVVGAKTWGQQLKSIHKRVAKMNRGFHFGNQPRIFGNLAEKKPSWATYGEKINH